MKTWVRWGHTAVKPELAWGDDYSFKIKKVDVYNLYALRIKLNYVQGTIMHILIIFDHNITIVKTI